MSVLLLSLAIAIPDAAPYAELDRLQGVWLDDNGSLPIMKATASSLPARTVNSSAG
jgi:hypothetical protein